MGNIKNMWKLFFRIFGPTAKRVLHTVLPQQLLKSGAVRF
jgi:hypothetical protein